MPPDKPITTWSNRIVTRERSGNAHCFHWAESKTASCKSWRPPLPKHTELSTALDLAKSVDVESTYVLGPLLVLYGLFERPGIDEVLKRVQGKHPRLGLSLREAVFSLTVSRFTSPELQAGSL